MLGLPASFGSASLDFLQVLTDEAIPYNQVEEARAFEVAPAPAEAPSTLGCLPMGSMAERLHSSRLMIPRRHGDFARRDRGILCRLACWTGQPATASVWEMTSRKA